MQYAYHIVPDEMVGTTLYPLNELKTIDRGAYERGVRKYLADPERNRPDRLALMRFRIPGLNCLWNDVIHMSAVHPRDLMAMWKSVGYVPKRAFVAFEIPLTTLDPEQIRIYKYEYPYARHVPWQFVRYDPEKFTPFTEITERATLAMKKMVVQRDVWHFIHIPHVMFRGRIETKHLRAVSIVL